MVAFLGSLILFAWIFGGKEYSSETEYREWVILDLLHKGQLEEDSLVLYPDELRIAGKIKRSPEEKGKGLAADFVYEPATEKGIDDFRAELQKYNQKLNDPAKAIGYRAKSSSFYRGLLANLLFLLLFVLLLYFLFVRPLRAGGPGGGLFGFGKSRARMVKKGSTGISFNDVAGIDEAKCEVREIVEFLKNPKKFLRLGGKIPKGVILAGAPGTGKTLLAKAIAGEADVPFYSISGSDFVEMFVGVGASRVRDLFKQARENAPCIVFLDEVDAVGRRRGTGLGGGHDEREQTLNAILVEMDGFDSESGIVIVAATNRPDVLDPALLRPGRLDREITIDLPDLEGREKILRVHTRNVKMAPHDIDLRRLAQLTPTFSGAELAALVNEAAIIAAMKDQDWVLQEDFEAARDKIRWGREKTSRTFTEDDKKVTAYHEAGHALVAHLLPEVEPLHKVTIIPRGMSLGSTMQIAERDRCHLTRRQLYGNLMVLYAGRIAEQMFCGDLSVGAKNDIERATDLARRMVCEWGMSEALGPVHYNEAEEALVLSREMAGGRNFSEETARRIDEEVRRLIDEVYQKAEKMIRKHKDEVERIGRALMAKETLTGEEVARLVDGEVVDLPAVPAGRS
ncbi:MAG: ATP-dependent zinc metalloprotease FtsH [Planctomycetes bacterium]|nr:ATP-dependent zinc metalloprotease FtsH [Planctomycetota bacterium]